MGFWWDSTHLATVDHYVNFVLKQPSVKRGTFPEDTLGREMLDAIKANGLKAAEPYAAYLWVEDEKGDNEECRVVGHLNGRHWRQFQEEPTTDAGGSSCEFANSRLAQVRRTLAAMHGGDGKEEEEVEQVANGGAEAMRREAPCVFDVADPPCRDCTDEDDDDTDMQIGHYAKAKREAADASPPLIWQPDDSPPSSSSPLISIILPIHNGEAWIDDCP